MLNIAICDDDPTHRDQIRELVSSYLHARPSLAGRVWTCSDGRALLARAREQGGFDVYLLDILMPALNGIEIGRRLRALGDGGEIVYLTSTNDFAADSYDVRAFFYLLKPVKEEKLFHVLDKAVKKFGQRHSSAIIVNTPEGPRRILLDHIRYAERIGRAIHYDCTNGTVDTQSIRVPFREATAPLLTDRRFDLCGASFVLNFQHVAGVDGQTALLDNGLTIPLPRTAVTDFKKAWGNYWLEQEEMSQTAPGDR